MSKPKSKVNPSSGYPHPAAPSASSSFSQQQSQSQQQQQQYLPLYTITGLTHILTPHEACQILGASTVRSVVKSFLRYNATNSLQFLRNNNNNANNNHDNTSNSNSYNNNFAGLKKEDKYHSIPFQQISDNVAQQNETEEEKYWIDLLTASLAFDFQKHSRKSTHTCNNVHHKRHSSGSGNSSSSNTTVHDDNEIPQWCVAAWHRLLNLPPQSIYTNPSLYSQQQEQNLQHLNAHIPIPLLGLDKSSFLRAGVLFPSCSAPSKDKDGHLILMEYLFAALATPSPMLILNRLTKASNPNRIFNEDGGGKTGIGNTSISLRNNVNSMYNTKMNNNSSNSSTTSGTTSDASIGNGGSGSVGTTSPHLKSIFNITGMNDGRATKSIILLPDLIIFWAISMNYQKISLTNGSIQVSSSSKIHQNPLTYNSRSDHDYDDGSHDYNEMTFTPSGLQSIKNAGEIAFRVFNSFHKRDILTRDTMNQFMNDIYGADTPQRRELDDVLDKMFLDPRYPSIRGDIGSRSGSGLSTSSSNALPHAPVRHLAYLDNAQFVEAVGNTAYIVPNVNQRKQLEPKHKVLDWVMHLGRLPQFVLQNQRFYEADSDHYLPMYKYIEAKLEMLTNMSLDSEIRKLCRRFEIIDNAVNMNTGNNAAQGNMQLFEVKRRFRSVVESNYMRKAKLMASSSNNNDDQSTNATDSTGSESSAEEGHHLPIDEDEGKLQSNSSNLSDEDQPRNVINEETFLQATSEPNDDLGHGGFLTPSLAKLVFQAGCATIRKSREQSAQKEVGVYVKRRIGQSSKLLRIDTECTTTDASDKYWTIYDVLYFGCNSVRGELVEDKEGVDPILKFIFSMFLLLPTSSKTIAHDIPAFVSMSSLGKLSEDQDSYQKCCLTRHQVGHMLLLFMDHAAFRNSADSTKTKSSEANEAIGVMEYSKFEKKLSEQKLEDIEIEYATAYSLGLLSPKSYTNVSHSSSIIHVSLSTLIDNVFQYEQSGKRTLSFHCFAKWCTGHSYLDHLDLNHIRSRSLSLDLQLIASTLFGVKPSSPRLEHTLVNEIFRRHHKKFPIADSARHGPAGTVWYIIPSSWWGRWEKYVCNTIDVSGNRYTMSEKIYNNKLLCDNGSLALRPNLRPKHDFEVVPPLVWSSLQAWHDGGPPIYRSVITFSEKISPLGTSPTRKRKQHNTYEIDFYPVFVTVLLIDCSSRGEARPFQQYVPVSRYLPLSELVKTLCKSLDVEMQNGRLWISGTPRPRGSKQSDLLLKLEKNLMDQLKKRGLLKSDEDLGEKNLEIILELKDKDGQWPTESRGKSENCLPNEQIESSTGDGIVGLHNMGNTCYMNSSIQCLSHTPILRDYFTSKAYLNDINRTNPLGYEGRLAQVSYVLINALWKRSPTQSNRFNAGKIMLQRHNAPLLSIPCITPKTFKDTLGKLNEDFCGNEQHDAQELLAFLLSGLSEDLNRIVDKPYIEAPDSDGRPDKELADIWWNNHLQREFSIIVALFTGQYKSLLTCSTCGYESARFEPFCFMQLPLPEDDQLTVSMLYYPITEEHIIMKYAIRVKHNGTLFDLLINFAKVLYADSKTDKEAISSDCDRDVDNDDDSQCENDPCYSIYEKMANNLSIVKIEHGCIRHILPTHWSATKTLNKETGEMDFLHVYELDSEAEKETIPSDPKSSSRHKFNNEHKEQVTKASFLAVCQRKPDLMSRPFLHLWTQKVFSTPILLRVVDLEGYSGKDLYDLIAQRVRPHVPPSVLPFLNGEHPDIGYNHEEDTAHRSIRRRRRRQVCEKSNADSEETAFGPLPRYGFRLRITSRDGKKCGIRPWFESCVGSLVPDDDCPTVVADGDTVAIDWHFAVDIYTDSFGTLVQNNAKLDQNTKLITQTIQRHHTCHSGRNKYGRGAITLEECLEAFSKEERIPEAYCSKCKDFRIQTKTMKVWRLPPVMIIHLKRFQFNQQIKRKLREYVHFPLEGLDFSQVVASDTFLKQNSKEYKANNSNKDNGDGNKSQSLYDLYAVVHHHGALSGGHYVASLKSEIDGKWRLFNDAQVYDISSNDVIDASAYILFYVSRELKGMKLEDVWDTQPREGEGMTEEEVQKMMKQRESRCNIQ